ncbi:MAG: aminopeptidase, partial [Lachnospiraceae bacterium]|nr:aminopeptidase [Lachnospiraceae bacterium]
MEKKSAWKKYSAAEVRKLDKLCDSYRDFLSVSKTERECVDYFVNEAEKAGYRELESLIGTKTKLKAGDKIYSVMMNKSIVLFQLGKRPITEGMNILGAHLDSPRMDLKPNPLYEKADIAYLDTHYYGGIKKYQWVTIPLAMHGVVVKKDGTTIDICIGEDEDDPVFFVSDLLIHLAADQMEKKGAKVIEGEALDLIVGNRPISIAPAAKGAKAKGEVKETKDAVKAGVLDILKKQYD